MHQKRVQICITIHRHRYSQLGEWGTHVRVEQAKTNRQKYLSCKEPHLVRLARGWNRWLFVVNYRVRVCKINNKQNARFPLSVTSFIFKGIPVLFPDLMRAGEREGYVQKGTYPFLSLPLTLLLANSIDPLDLDFALHTPQAQGSVSPNDAPMLKLCG